MRREIIAGACAGAALGLAGVVGASFAEQDARGQSGQRAQQSIPPQIASANLRSQRGIKQATTVWNQLGIYLAEPGTQIRAKGPRVSQLPAVGGGIPLSALDSETQNAIRGASGPQGPKGDPGPAGPAGPPGPTDGASGRTIPPPALDSGLLLPSNLPPTPSITEVTTSVAGRLFLTASYQYVVACPSSMTVDSWIVLNGTPIPSTFARFGDVAGALPPGGGPLRTNSGVTDEVIDAGTHRIHVGVRCSVGTSAPAALGQDVIASAIVLG